MSFLHGYAYEKENTRTHTNMHTYMAISGGFIRAKKQISPMKEKELLSNQNSEVIRSDVYTAPSRPPQSTLL